MESRNSHPDKIYNLPNKDSKVWKKIICIVFMYKGNAMPAMSIDFAL